MVIIEWNINWVIKFLIIMVSKFSFTQLNRKRGLCFARKAVP